MGCIMPKTVPKKKNKSPYPQKDETAKQTDPRKKYLNDPDEWRPGELPFPSD